jgi:hypothetical protein
MLHVFSDMNMGGPGVKARAACGARDAVFVIGVKEGIIADLVSRHEVEDSCNFAQSSLPSCTAAAH